MRSSSSPSSIATAILFLHLLLLTLLQSTQPISATTGFFSCSQTGEVDTNSTYAANIAQTLISLTNLAPRIGFANLTVGDTPSDTIYSLALCRGDLNSTSCQSCLRLASTDAPQQCPGSTSAAVFYDECRLRYSSQPFFSTLTPDPRDAYYFSLRRLTDLDYFRNRFGRLMGDLRQRASYGNESGLYASGWIEYGLGGADRLYGLVQCTRDLSPDQCAQCLDAPIREIINRYDSDEMTFQGGSCYLRYGFWLFFNGSIVAPPPLTAMPSVTGTAGNASVDVSPSPPSPPSLFGLGGSADGGGQRGGKKHIAAAIIVVILGVCLVALLLLIAVVATRKKKPRQIKLGTRNLELQEEDGLKFHRLASKKKNFYKDPRSPGSVPFDLQKLDGQALKFATENFSSSRVIGRGEYGIVYKGELSGREFAVKRITAEPRMDLVYARKEFKALVRVQHPNIAKILACHLEDDDRFFVYEYYHNASLDQILFDNKKRVLLDWGRRFKIIEGIGQGLLHLHGDSGTNTVHHNLKASNVLLDRQMAPKLADMCLPAFFLPNQTSPPGGSKKNGGSSVQGYMAPEYFSSGIPTAKTDVFGYGVLVLEIITGHRNWEFLGPENGTNLLSYVWQYWKDEKALQVLDWSLGELYKAHEVLRCVHVGLLCVQEDPDNRPNMSTVVSMLNSFSFTLPSPAAPPLTRGGGSRKNGNSGGLPPTHPNNGSRDRGMNRQITRLSPRSSWDDIKLDSR